LHYRISKDGVVVKAELEWSALWPMLKY